MADALDVEAEKILALPSPANRARLSAVLDRVKHQPQGSSEQERLLTFGAHLCTRIREIAESRHLRHPWNT